MTQQKDGKDRVFIFDTTLRDGEQCPGATMTHEQKIEVAEFLDTMGVDIIEAGFPVNGEGAFRAVQEIAQRTKNAVVCGLARAKAEDIDAAGRAIKPAKQGRIHTFIATSPLHMKRKLNKKPDEVLELITWSVTRARNLTDDVEWSCEDGTQSEIAFLFRCVEAAIKAGATTINIPDTCGYTEPLEYHNLIWDIMETVSNSVKARFSVHCHNDLGMAVANSHAGIRAGARQIECTVNGIGERAGNTALEEVVMGIRTRPDRFPFYTGIDTTMLTRVSKLVSAVTSFPVQYNKAIVGKNAFAHESGIHQDGMLKDSRMYEIMTPESVGLKQSTLVMGKHSGKHGFVRKLEELGYQLADNQIVDAFARFKVIADRKKTVTDEDIEALVDEQMATDEGQPTIVSATAIASTEAVHPAVVKLKIDGVEVLAAGEGNGPVDAVFKAIKSALPHDGVVTHYNVVMIGREDSDAQAEASIRITVETASGPVSVGAKGADPDTIVASAKAYLLAVNKLKTKLNGSALPPK